MTHHASVRFMRIYPALLFSYTCRLGLRSSPNTQQCWCGDSEVSNHRVQRKGENGAGLTLLWAMTTSNNPTSPTKAKSSHTLTHTHTNGQNNNEAYHKKRQPGACLEYYAYRSQYRAQLHLVELRDIEWYRFNGIGSLHLTQGNTSQCSYTLTPSNI